MKLLFTDKCPICQQPLSERRYMSRSKKWSCGNYPHHYEGIMYDESTETIEITLEVENYSITCNNFNDPLTTVRKRKDDKLSIIMELPKIEFDWNDLPSLAKRIANLLAFS